MLWPWLSLCHFQSDDKAIAWSVSYIMLSSSTQGRRDYVNTSPSNIIVLPFIHCPREDNRQEIGILTFPCLEIDLRLPFRELIGVNRMIWWVFICTFCNGQGLESPLCNWHFCLEIFGTFFGVIVILIS